MKNDTLKSFKYEGQAEQGIAEMIKERLQLTDKEKSATNKIEKPDLQTGYEKSVIIKSSEPNRGSWSWVRCMEGYYLLELPFLVNGRKIFPRVIKSHDCTKKMDDYIVEYGNRLPVFYWKLSGNNTIRIIDIEKFVQTIPVFVHQEKLWKLGLNQYKEFMYGNWSWVHFTKGYCIFKPPFLIAERAIESLKISIPNSNESVNEYVLSNKNRLRRFCWKLNENGKVILDDTKVFNKVVSDFMGMENEKLRKLVSSKCKLEWNDVKKHGEVYVFCPRHDSFQIHQLTINASVDLPKIHDLIQCSKKLPDIHYKVSKKLEIVDFEHDAFMDALDKCKEILIRKSRPKRPRICDINNFVQQSESEVQTRFLNKEEKQPIKEKKKSNDTIRQFGWQESYENLKYKGVDMSIFEVEHVLNWTDVRFEYKKYVFEPKFGSRLGNNKIVPLIGEDFRCRKSFNYIPSYFQERLPKIIYRITKDFKIRLNNKPMFEVALIDMAKYERVDNEIDVDPVRKRFGSGSDLESAISKGAAMKPEDFEKYKSNFINFLLLYQMKEYKIVSVSEALSYRGRRFDEASFIFTAKTYTGYVLIILENVNPDRATIVFQVKEERYMIALGVIFNYIQSDSINKRSTLRDHNAPLEKFGVRMYWSINHDSLYDWKRRLMRDLK